MKIKYIDEFFNHIKFYQAFKSKLLITTYILYNIKLL